MARPKVPHCKECKYLEDKNNKAAPGPLALDTSVQAVIFAPKFSYWKGKKYRPPQRPGAEQGVNPPVLGNSTLN